MCAEGSPRVASPNARVVVARAIPSGPSTRSAPAIGASEVSPWQSLARRRQKSKANCARGDLRDGERQQRRHRPITFKVFGRRPQHRLRAPLAAPPSAPRACRATGPYYHATAFTPSRPGADQLDGGYGARRRQVGFDALTSREESAA